ncbi:MAG: acyl-CoA desaturase [Fuerstiella sp.]|nr:acyl-CoA desaturase [Fuerstiella sp.]MCP4858922.1 acyl-CoA desaturase [Fuerstiella sp.]
MPALRKRVDAYFAETNVTKRDNPRMYVKTVIILAWLTLSYVSLVFWATTWPQALVLSVSLGVAMSAAGFNIMHDGGHGSYSRFPLINRLAAFSLDILGGSSYFWRRKHNVVHHSYTNVTGIDDDIDVGPLGRLSPHQRRIGVHRFQQFYLWFLYGLITFKWQFYDDAAGLITGRIGQMTMPRVKAWDLTFMLIGKLIFLALAVGLPLYLHEWQHVVLWFFVASFAQGVVLSVVFQLAHCVEQAEFYQPDPASMRIDNAWAVHQVVTTVDFARGSRLVSWFTGGLNFQIEHHLFPHICHLHYPALSRIVEQTSAEFGVPYHSHPTMRSAVKSHFLWLRRMGQPVAVSG